LYGLHKILKTLSKNYQEKYYWQTVKRERQWVYLVISKRWMKTIRLKRGGIKKLYKNRIRYCLTINALAGNAE
jgi:hypothetical protein